MKNCRLWCFVILLAASGCGRVAVETLTPARPAAISTGAIQSPASTPTACTPPEVTPSAAPEPAWEWPRSSPEEQGLSSADLAGMLERTVAQGRNIHSILVVRHGTLVLEIYRQPFNPGTRHAVYSVTKSITSTLVGIAAGEGLIDVNTPVYEYFPTADLDDPRKEEITVGHLLAMTSGVTWLEPQHSGLSDLWGIHAADDPVQYFFTPALAADPGTVFNYNSGGSHLLSILVQQTSGKTAAEFAREHLFGALDIREYAWQSDAAGHTQGGTGLELLPADMAKIGQVMLDRGKWQGRQVVPAGWVQEAVEVHSLPDPQTGYGFQWWLRPNGDYYALGWGGQQIHVFPQQDMVAVFTAGESGENILYADLIDDYLIPAAKSDATLPENVSGQGRLEEAVRAFEAPILFPSNPIPEMAYEVDGKTWLVTGMGDWSLFSLRFPGGPVADLDLEMTGDTMPLEVGLDGIYRITDTDELGPVALAGWWEAPDTFVLVQQNLREADRRTTHLHFAGKEVAMLSEWLVEPYSEESEAKLFDH